MDRLQASLGSLDFIRTELWPHFSSWHLLLPTQAFARDGPSICPGHSAQLSLTFGWLPTLNNTSLKEAFPVLLITGPCLASSWH